MNYFCRIFVLGILISVSTSVYANTKTTLLRGALSTKAYNKDLVLTKSQIQADIDLFIFALTHAYAGYHFKPEKGSMKYIQLLQSWPIPESMTAQKFGKYLYDNLTLILDNHFSIYPIVPSQSRPRITRPGLGVGSNYGNCGCQQSICNGHTCSVQQNVWELNNYNDDTQIPVLSIHSFPGKQSSDNESSDTNPWKGMISAVQTAMKSTTHLIIDLRGNPGGDDGMGYSLAETLRDCQSIPNLVSTARDLQSDSALEIFLNMIDLMITKATSQNIDPGAYTTYKLSKEKLLKEAKSGNLPLVSTESPKSPSSSLPTPGANAFQGQVFVITDRHTASSAEETAQILKTTVGAKIVGENSGGFLAFGNLGGFTLPNSKIVITFGTTYFERVDHTFHEMVGYTPDLITPQNTDALEYLVKNMIFQK